MGCIFFSAIEEIEVSFAKQLKKIPTSTTQKQSEAYSKMAGASKLDKFGDFALIDTLVKAYQGVYNHNDIFNLDVLFVHNLILYNKQLNYIDSRKEEIQRQVQLAKKP